ncbi:MAG TPA: hypothetical protein VJY15_01165 [Candidatus Acidoferrum sp.]|nr:hypothetical protein [Candidatus Acidoferrum sp.]
MKVSLYTREHGSRQYKKHNPKASYRAGTIWVLRYGSTWETLDVASLSEATTLRIRSQMEINGGLLPTRKAPKQPTVLMLDKAKDDYLAEIEKGRKPKTHAAYSVALKYFYECVGNKPMSPRASFRSQILAWATQSLPASAYGVPTHSERQYCALMLLKGTCSTRQANPCKAHARIMSTDFLKKFARLFSSPFHFANGPTL